MNVRAATVFFWVSLMAGAALASEEYRSEIKIAIDGDGDQPQVFEWHSDDPDSDLSKLEVGESKTIAMPHDDHHSVVKKSKKVKVIKTDDSNGVTIISGDELDAATRARIEAALEDAGKDGKVIFIDGSELGGTEQVHGEHKVIIRKEIEKTTN